MSRILLTGAAGFIGHHVTAALLARGEQVLGVDNLNDYYDVSLKQARMARLQTLPGYQGFNFAQLDLRDAEKTAAMFAQYQPELVIHLAAQAGVRHSLQAPLSYVDNNLLAFTNILEGCRHGSIKHLVYASSSSVYGGNTKLPFSEQNVVDHPVSLYAATKKANELMAHTYSHLYQFPTTGLRFFTVYGPWGRPDMSPFLFADAILNGRAIKVFNHGKMLRDFTYIDDIVQGVLKVLDKPATPLTSTAPYRIFNIGNSQPAPLLDFIALLEQHLGKTAPKEFLPMQAGDVPATYADTAALEAWVGFRPQTPLASGLQRFCDWYQDYYATTQPQLAHA
ncbi:NAD-dependent epimerase [Methylobacillus glycogenes]|uniref:NAD-dependent epimerase n=1 Tax=Methylobacillus glycogenes TaxID=406 RepID=UPI000470AC69|nr:NAD-dependent epimerase [Methylobacillus glycogenes]